MDALSALLLRLNFGADTFFHGDFCGSNDFPEAPQRGQLHLVHQGSVSLTHDDGSVLQVTGPALVLYPRPCAHVLATDGKTAQLLCAHLQVGGAEDAVLDALPGCLQISKTQMPALAGLLELLFDEAQHAALGRKLILDRLCEVLVVQSLRHALASDALAAGKLFGLADAALARAMQAMRDHPGTHWTVESLAHLCGMSRSRFARQFHAVVGCPPAQYLGSQRIAHAQVLLRQGKLVQDITLAVGYRNQPAFTRAFTAATGLSPRDWLARHGQFRSREHAR